MTSLELILTTYALLMIISFICAGYHCIIYSGKRMLLNALLCIFAPYLFLIIFMYDKFIVKKFDYAHWVKIEGANILISNENCPIAIIFKECGTTIINDDAMRLQNWSEEARDLSHELTKSNKSIKEIKCTISKFYDDKYNLKIWKWKE